MPTESTVSSTAHPPGANPSVPPKGLAETPAPRPPHSPWRRLARWSLWLVGLLVAALVLVGVGVAVLDWNRVKPWVNAKVSEASGRHFAIEGDMSVGWRWPLPLEDGWQRWVP